MTDATETLFDQRLQAAAKSEDPLVLQNLTTALAAIGGDREVGMLAELIVRLIPETGEGPSVRHFELWQHIREEVRTLTPAQRVMLRDHLERVGRLGEGKAVVGLIDDKDSLWAQARAAWLGWPRPYKLALGLLAGVAGGLLVWFALFISAFARGLVVEPSHGFGLLLSATAFLIGSAAGTGAVAACASAGLPRERLPLRLAESLVVGAAASVFGGALAFPVFFARGAELRTLLFGDSGAFFAGGYSRMVAFLCLTLAIAATRILSRRLTERASSRQTYLAGWTVAATIAALLTGLLYLLLPRLGPHQDFAVGCWLIAVPMVFATAISATYLEAYPSRFELVKRISPARMRIAAIVAFAALVSMLMLPALRAIAPLDTGVRNIDLPSATSIVTREGGQYEFVALPISSAVPVGLQISGGTLVAPDVQGTDPQPYRVGNAAVVRASGSRIDICAFQGAAGPTNDLAKDCAPDRLWWLRTILRVTQSRPAGKEAVLYLAGGSRLMRRVELTSSIGARYFEVRPGFSVNFNAVFHSNNQNSPPTFLLQAWEDSAWVPVVANLADPTSPLLPSPSYSFEAALGGGRYRLCFEVGCEKGPSEGTLFYVFLPDPRRPTGN